MRVAMDDPPPTVVCSAEQREELQSIARSTTAGIWRIKRAKIILGILEGKSIDRLVLEVRVPPLSIIKCRQQFAKAGMAYFAKPDRKPTPREASVERLLVFLEAPPDPSAYEWDALSHRYIGIHFSARQIRTIRELIATNLQYTRTQLAREVCSQFNFHQPNGKMRTNTVVGILKRMDMDNMIALPPLPHSGHRVRPHNGKLAAVPGENFEGDPRDLKKVRFVLVEAKADLALWNALIHEHHYIKTYRMFGPQLRYLVYGSRRTDPQKVSGESAAMETRSDPDQPTGGTLVAALGFASSAWRLSSREAFIGWTEQQRVANLRYVVSNARFLILPWIRCPNLASSILGRVVRRLPRDWEERYHYRPVLLETFVQLDRFTGTCYKAANWIRLGTTDGYSLYGKKQKKQVPDKAIFVYPLTRKFRERLCGSGV